MFKRIMYFFVIIIAVFVLSFITREIVVAAEGVTPHGNFYVSTYNGHVAVYNRFGSLCRETTRTVDSLDKRIRELIHKHVYFNDIDDMNRFIDSL